MGDSVSTGGGTGSYGGRMADVVVPRTRTSALDAFVVPHFGLIWCSGLLWHLCRWGVAFLGTFLVNDLTGSPRLVQLTGTMLYGPLLVGGILGGVVSDRIDRLNTVRVQLLVILPLTALIGVLVATDRIEVWMLYLYMFAVGIGWVTDMTSRRALVFDVVGESRMGNAMALESVSLSSGMVIGSLVGGTVVDALGVAWAYGVIAALMGLAFLVLVPVRRPTPAPRSTADPGPEQESAPAPVPVRPVQDLVEGIRALRTNRGVMSILGVTAVANFFLFAYFPIVPVVAENLGARPFQVGLLTAGTGIGMMTGSLLVAKLQPRRRGLWYVAGVALAMAMIIPFALTGSYAVALAALILSGIGGGFFGSTQSALVMAESPEHLRGRALGLLSMAIGALPIGMYLLGESAERLGVANALLVHIGLGLAALVAWVGTHPTVRRITT